MAVLLRRSDSDGAGHERFTENTVVLDKNAITLLCAIGFHQVFVRAVGCRTLLLVYHDRDRRMRFPVAPADAER